MSVGMWIVMGVMMGIMMGGMAYAGVKSLLRRIRGRDNPPSQR